MESRCAHCMHGKLPRTAGAAPSAFASPSACGGTPSLFEGIAVPDAPGLQPSREPLRALGRGAVSERVGIHTPAGHLLNPVVADGRCCAEALLDVAGLEDSALLRGRRPYP